MFCRKWISFICPSVYFLLANFGAAFAIAYNIYVVKIFLLPVEITVGKVF